MLNKESINKIVKKINWKVMLIIQVVIIYLLSLVGYHTSRMPVSFDKFLHNTGLWRVYGYKNYSLEGVMEIYDSDRNEVYFYEELNGIVTEMEGNNLAISNVHGEKIRLEDYEELRVCYIGGFMAHIEDNITTYTKFEDGNSECVRVDPDKDFARFQVGDFVKLMVDGRYLIAEDSYKIDLIKLTVMD